MWSDLTVSTTKAKQQEDLVERDLFPTSPFFLKKKKKKKNSISNSISPNLLAFPLLRNGTWRKTPLTFTIFITSMPISRLWTSFDSEEDWVSTSLYPAFFCLMITILCPRHLFSSSSRWRSGKWTPWKPYRNLSPSSVNQSRNSFEKSSCAPILVIHPFRLPTFKKVFLFIL